MKLKPKALKLAISLIFTAAVLAVYYFIASFMPGAGMSGKVERVADGDTFTFRDGAGQNLRVRLYGVDAPELAQRFGERARDALAALLAEGHVDLDVRDRDQYGRLVAIVKAGNLNVNRELVASGNAWVYPGQCKAAFCGEWFELEETARAQRFGLWRQENPTPPWKWRHKR